MNDRNTSTYVIVLREKLRSLRIEILFLLNQWYHLKSEVYPDFKYRYRNLFGDLVFDLDEKKTLAMEMDLRVKEIIAKINSNKQVSSTYLHNTFNLNFSKRKYVNPVSDDYDIFELVSKEYLNTYIPNCDINIEYELVQLYRQVVKRVHPDINGLNETFNKYWDNIQDSYKTKDLSRLRLFHKLICEEIPNEFPDIKDEEIFLKLQINQLEKSIIIEKQKIRKVKSQEPFCFDNLLNDPIWVRKKRLQLTNEINSTEQLINRNKNILKRIIDTSKKIKA